MWNIGLNTQKEITMNRTWTILGLAFVGIVLLALALQAITGSGLVWWIALAVIATFTVLGLTGVLNTRNGRQE